MQIKLAQTDAQIEQCYPIMAQLWPQLSGSSEFLTRVKRQTQHGYQLAYLEENGAVKAVTGFKVLEMFSRGRFLYVDDLVTGTTERSQGYGSHLFDWLVEYAKTQNCAELHLDCRVDRFDTHRFYFKKRMHIFGYHFKLKLNG